MDKITRIKEIARKYMAGTPSSHDWSHVERVYKLAVTIGEKEKGDLEVIKTAAWLHDIARDKEARKLIHCHAEEGAKMATEILSKLEFPKETTKKVSSAILTHRYAKHLKPESLEGEIIQDADRLDTLGAICIGRIFTFGGENNRPLYDPNIPPRPNSDMVISRSSINYFFEKILKLKPETFNTATARKIAKRRYQFTNEFVDEFLKEWEGKL